MPTIEIVSINSIDLKIKQEDFNLAIIEEGILKSHRGLFNDFLSKQAGVIIHLGNPDFKEDKEGGYFAGMLVDWDFESSEIFFPRFDENDPECEDGANQQYKFKLRAEYQLEINHLLKKALDLSPVKKAYFITDYQFGPAKPEFYAIGRLKEFWTEHDTRGLRFNTAYEISEE